MKPKRRVVPGTRSRRTPTVRRIKPAIVPVPRPAPGPRVPAPSRSAPGSLDATRGDARPVEPPMNRAAADLTGELDLTVDLGRDLVLANPLLAAAGVFGYGVEVVDQVDLARLGGLVTRGTTLKPRAGHGSPRMVEVPAGVLTSTALHSPGVELVVERYAPAWSGWPVPVIVNLCGESISDFAELARRLDGVPGVAGLELNLACARGSRRGALFGLEASSAASLVGAVRRATELPLVAKLSPVAADPSEIARAVEQAGADAVSAVSALPGLALAADRRGPALADDDGGISGPALRPVALRVVRAVAGAVDVPVIGIGGVASLDDVLDMLAVGASAVGVGVAALADPALPVRLAEELAGACVAAGVSSVADLVGTARSR